MLATETHHVYRKGLQTVRSIGILSENNNATSVIASVIIRRESVEFNRRVIYEHGHDVLRL
jgi:hypothetical protein